LFANPPLVISEDQIGEALEAFDEALLIADAATSAAGAAAPAGAALPKPWRTTT
jgi:hypothetical protein